MAQTKTQRTKRAPMFTNTRERKPAHRSRTRQDPGAARAQKHARTRTRVGDARGEGHDCRRCGHARQGRARPGEGLCHKVGGHPHGPGAPRPWLGRNHTHTKGPGGYTRACVRALGPGDPSPSRGVILKTRVRGRQGDAHTKELLPFSHRHPEGPTFAERGHRTKGTHPLGPTKAVPHPLSAPAPRPTQTHSGHHRERRTHPHTHHTPTEGVWRAPLPGHLGCSATM